MASRKRSVVPWFLGLLGIIALIVVLLQWWRPSLAAPYRGTRAMAIGGYFLILASILSSNYVPQLARRFGRPFVAIHHWAALSGLIFITLHPVILALAGNGWSVFIPVFSSWREFWIYAGRPAWFLLLLAVIAAGLRQRWKNGWRIVHGLTYVAFIMGTIHATLIGTSIASSPVTQAIFYALALLATGVFIRRRYEAWRRAQARARRRA